MTKLRLSAIHADRPVKVTVELPAPVFRDLQAYAAIIARTAGEAEPSQTRGSDASEVYGDG